MTREEVLAEARKCVCGGRDKSYGGPENSFECIAKMWTAYLRQRGLVRGPKNPLQKNENSNKVPTSSDRITAWDVAWMMILLKASRAAGNTTYTDGCIDAAGYAACAGECMEEPAELRPDQLPAQGHSYVFRPEDLSPTHHYTGFKVGDFAQFKTGGGCTGC